VEAQGAESLVGNGFAVGDKEEEVAGFGAGAFLQGSHFGRGDKFLGGAFDAFGGEGQGGETFGALLFG